MSLRARFNIQQNIEIQVLDSSKKIKKVFQPNKLFLWLLKHHLVSPFIRAPWLGYWSDSMNISNLVTNAGAAGVASRINGSGAEAAFTYVAVGTGTTAAAVTDTTLETELATSGLSRAAATATRITTDVTNDTAKLSITYSVSGTAAVTESGVFNAASSGVLLARQVFSAINVVSGDSLVINWSFDVD